MKAFAEKTKTPQHSERHQRNRFSGPANHSPSFHHCYSSASEVNTQLTSDGPKYT